MRRPMAMRWTRTAIAHFPKIVDRLLHFGGLGGVVRKLTPSADINRDAAADPLETADRSFDSGERRATGKPEGLGRGGVAALDAPDRRLDRAGIRPRLRGPLGTDRV